MNDKHLISGVIGTTHVDRHGERLFKENLEQMAQAFNESSRADLIYWNHETTLPPLGVITNNWVERREDGEYQLRFEGHLIQSGELLSQSNIEGLDITWEQVEKTRESLSTLSPDHLRVFYDPRNLEKDEVTPLIEEMNKLVETQQHLRIRKADLPQAVIWILISFAVGQFAAGFFSRLGEISAEKTLEALGELFAKLCGKADQERNADIVFGIPIPSSNTNVEGAIENADIDSIRAAVKKLPELYTFARILLKRNPTNFFSDMKFLYNPEIQRWEINYLVTSKTNQIIKGPRYDEPKHPLRHRYEKMLKQLSEQTEEELGMSFGAQIVSHDVQ